MTYCGADGDPTVRFFHPPGLAARSVRNLAPWTETHNASVASAGACTVSIRSIPACAGNRNFTGLEPDVGFCRRKPSVTRRGTRPVRGGRRIVFSGSKPIQKPREKLLHMSSRFSISRLARASSLSLKDHSSPAFLHQASSRDLSGVILSWLFRSSWARHFCSPCAGVYPRVCGGTNRLSGRYPHVHGLSPRVRGNHRNSVQSVVIAGSIPACAGEPFRQLPCRHSTPVYPRVCGEPDTDVSQRPRVRVYPRVCGGTRADGRIAASSWVYPRGAGEPYRRRNPAVAPTVYPRVCGGTPDPQHERRCCDGLSPRVRGNLPLLSKPYAKRGLSPRVRGNLALVGEAGPERRSIPRVRGNQSGFV